MYANENGYNSPISIIWDISCQVTYKTRTYLGRMFQYANEHTTPAEALKL